MREGCADGCQITFRPNSQPQFNKYQLAYGHLSVTYYNICEYAPIVSCILCDEFGPCNHEIGGRKELDE